MQKRQEREDKKGEKEQREELSQISHLSPLPILGEHFLYNDTHVYNILDGYDNICDY